ncbi:hypothetical protein LWL40_27750 (plasmid) [Bacillus thuringiensis]|uniref:hypothetical protein n=1 Tax=Bacillus thuringiensis TaxID=1428 RepID=UPI003D75F6FE
MEVENMETVLNCAHRQGDTIRLSMKKDGNIALMAEANGITRTIFVNPKVLLGILSANLVKDTPSDKIKCLQDKHTYHMRIRQQRDNTKSVRIEVYGRDDYAIVILSKEDTDKAIRFACNVIGLQQELAVK